MSLHSEMNKMDDLGWAATMRNVITVVVDWLFRRRSPWVSMVRAGVALLGSSGLFFSLKIPLANGIFVFTLDTSGGTPALVAYGVALLGALLIIAGIVMEVRHARAEQVALDRKRVFVIEQRGLRDITDTPLADAVPSALSGRRETILVNLRQGVEDGRIVKPEVALDRINILPRDLEQRRASIDRADTSVVYGGLVPVPFAFLTGLLLDDESAITVMDWDRDAERWRVLNGADDGDRFLVSGLNVVTAGASDVIVVVSVSYKVNLPAVVRTVGNLPVVRLDLPNGSTSCHWSEEKQRALAREFRDVMVKLSNHRVGTIHLFIAAPNSIVFRFGRAYDKRNLPSVRVYQYEQSCNPPYPWAVIMPTHGIERAVLHHVVII